MDKDIFNQRIKPLGKFKKVFGGIDNPTAGIYLDKKFIPIKRTEKCNDCAIIVQGQEFIYEVKWDRKDRAYWQKKCLNCGLKSPHKNV